MLILKWFEYAVAILLVVAVLLFIKVALFDKRPQKTGLLLSLLAIPMYLVYYNDHWPFHPIAMRDVVHPLTSFNHRADANFHSSVAPAVILFVIAVTYLIVFQRVAVRRRLQRLYDPIANFFALAMVATLLGGTIVSTFKLGWIGAIIVTVVMSLVYLGVLALIGAIIEVLVALGNLFLVWLKRRAFWLATMITRLSSWISSLSGRLVSRRWIEQIREDTANQESIFAQEQESQDRALYEAYLRDRRRKRKLLEQRGVVLKPEDLVDPDISVELAERVTVVQTVTTVETVEPAAGLAADPVALQLADPEPPALQLAEPTPEPPAPTPVINATPLNGPTAEVS
jgi:hypothetical protein